MIQIKIDGIENVVVIYEVYKIQSTKRQLSESASLNQARFRCYYLRYTLDFINFINHHYIFTSINFHLYHQQLVKQLEISNSKLASVFITLCAYSLAFFSSSQDMCICLETMIVSIC